MLWDLMQQRQIGKAQQAATHAASSVSRAEDDIDELRRTIETLMLTCQAMWEISREKNKVTDEALLQRMQEIDLRDGKADGKMGAGVSTCPDCKRPNNSRHERCVYCGETLPPPPHVFAKG